MPEHHAGPGQPGTADDVGRHDGDGRSRRWALRTGLAGGVALGAVGLARAGTPASAAVSGPAAAGRTAAPFRLFAQEDLNFETLLALGAAGCQGGQFYPGQAQQVYGLLRSPKALYTFTTAQGAEYHDAPMAPQARNQVVYDWLSRYP